MRKFRILKQSSMIFVAILMMVFTFTASNVNMSAAQIINFSGAGVLTVNNDGSFDAVGADVNNGTIDGDTSIVADGDLELILNNTNEVQLSSIEANTNLIIHGSGKLAINNTSGPGIKMGGNLEINSNLSIIGFNYGIQSPGVGNVTLNNAVLNVFGTDNYGISTQVGSVNVNNGQVYAGGKFSSVITYNGDINVIGTTALIESTSRNGFSVRTEFGNILIDAGRIYVPDSSLDAISAGRDTTLLTVKNGGVAEGFGKNAGVVGGTVLVDNATIIGSSNRIATSAKLNYIVQNGATVTGTAFDKTDQSYGLISWGGDINVTTDSVVTGTGEIGVVGYAGSVKAIGGQINGYGEQYGVEAVGSVIVEDGGIIIGESTNQVQTARGVGARVNMSADNGTIIGSSLYRGVFAAGTMDADNGSLIKGDADKRMDGNAAVFAASITANNGSAIHETYAADVTHVTEEESNPYFDSKNMSNFKNFNWTAPSGSVAKGTNGIYATSASDNQTVLTAERMHEVGVNEVVELTSSGANKHIIQLPVTLTPKGVPVDPGKPIINPEKPDVSAPSIKEGVIIGTRSGPNTGDQNKNAYFVLITISLAAFTFMGMKKRKLVNKH